MKLFTLFTALLIATTQTSHAAGKTEKREVTSDYQLYQGDWNSGAGSIYLRWKTYNTDGKVEICGVFSSTGQAHYQTFNQELLASAKVLMDGEKAKWNLRYFRVAPNEGRKRKHVGELANCYLTDAAYKDGAKFGLQFKKGTYSVER